MDEVSGDINGFHSQLLRVRVEDWLYDSARGTVGRAC